MNVLAEFSSRVILISAITLHLAACTRGGPDETHKSAPFVTSYALGETARAYLDSSSFAWQVAESTHMRIYVPTGSAVASHLPDLIDSVEAARTAVLRILGEEDRQVNPNLQSSWWIHAKICSVSSDGHMVALQRLVNLPRHSSPDQATVPSSGTN